jgi:hypothetical protein
MPPDLQEDPEVSALREAWQRGKSLSAPGLTVAAGGVLILGPVPGWRPPGRRAAARVAGLALLALLLGLRVLADRWLVVTAEVAIVAGLLAAVLAVLGLIRNRAGVARLTAAGVIVPTWYGRDRLVARDQIQRLVLVAVDFSPLPLTVPRLLIIGDVGRCLLPVGGTGVAVPALQAFAAAARVPVAGWPGPVGTARLRREYPGSVPWLWAVASRA